MAWIFFVDSNEAAAFHFLGVSEGTISRFADKIFFAQSLSVGTDKVDGGGKAISNEREFAAYGLVGFSAHIGEQFRKAVAKRNQPRAGWLDEGAGKSGGPADCRRIGQVLKRKEPDFVRLL